MDNKWTTADSDECIKRLMEELGQPNSLSLYRAFKQLELEICMKIQPPWGQPVPPVNPPPEEQPVINLPDLRGRGHKNQPLTNQKLISSLRKGGKVYVPISHRAIEGMRASNGSISEEETYLIVERADLIALLKELPPNDRAPWQFNGEIYGIRKLDAI